MLGSVIIMAWNLLTALGGLALVDRVGRRKLLLPGVGLMAVSLLLMKPVYAQIEAGMSNADGIEQSELGLGLSRRWTTRTMLWVHGGEFMR